MNTVEILEELDKVENDDAKRLPMVLNIFGKI
jgi:hypothetical protein